MQLEINIEDCIGCGVCSLVCPDIFQLDEDAGKAGIFHIDRAEEEENLVREAIDSCPIGCINS